LAHDSDCDTPIFAWVSLIYMRPCLKKNGLRFGKAIALMQHVKRKAQAQGETIDTALFPTLRQFLLLTFLQIPAKILTNRPLSLDRF
jgi:hypothetical protein